MQTPSILKTTLSLLMALLLLDPAAQAFAPPFKSSSFPITRDDQSGCKTYCGETIERRPAFIEIDANTGEVLNGTTRFAEGEKVQVIVTNKNPFKYAYRVQIVTAPLDTIIVSAFLKLIPGFSELVDSLTNTTKAGGTGPGGGVCSGPANGTWQLLLTKAQPLTNKDAEIKKDVESRNEAYKLYKKLYDETNGDRIKDCEVVCKDAADLSANMSKLTNLAALQKEVDQFKKDTADLQPLITTFQTAFNTLSPGDKALCNVEDAESDLGKTFSNVKALASNAAKYGDAVTKLQDKDNQSAFQLIAELIQAAQRSEAFNTVKFPYTAAGPTGVRITISRKNLREQNAQETQVALIDLQVGESPFSISAGVGFSTIENRKVIRQPFAKPDGSIGARFGEENKSSVRPSAVVMLNGSLKRFRAFAHSDGSFALSTGLVLSNRNNTTEAEFIAGPSLGLLNNKLFLTIGYHAARVETVGGGFKIGDDIPSSITDPLPVERNWKGGFMFAITYKLR
jgi:hypothetical protein